MPSVRSSLRPSLKGWQPLTTPPSGGTTRASAPPPGLPPERSPFMHAAMPVMASTADVFTRQFYGPSSLPQARILPAPGKAKP
jgi:hypothetical protein